MATAIVALAIGVPALVFALWPLLRGRERSALLPLPSDAREPLLEQKRRLLRALRELEFEHDAGHVSDADYAELRARYETETAALLTELDRLGLAPETPARPRREAPAPPRAAWRHPVAVGVSALALVVFGVALGVGIVAYTAPDPMAGTPLPGSRPLATLEPAPAPAEATGAATPRPVSPEMLRGMLEAARASLFAGRYSEAIAAYRAVLKRDPDNVDALTHLGLIVAIGGHADAAIESFDRVLRIDPDYPPALLYRGQVLWEVKRDGRGAVASWERFLQVVPDGQDRERVKQLIAEVKAAW